MDHTLLQSRMPQRMAPTQQSISRKPLRHPEPQEQPAVSSNTVNITCSVLSAHGTHWKHFDDNNFLPPYYETETKKSPASHGLEVAVQVHDCGTLNGSRAPLFEDVRLTLHGAIKTGIGKHAASQKVSSRGGCSTSGSFCENAD